MKFAKNDGFTLVELIVVIAILAILAGAAVPAYSGYIERAEIAADPALVSAVNTAFASAVVDNGTEIYTVNDAKFDSENAEIIGVKLNNWVDEKALDDYKASFKTYYSGNEDAEFKSGLGIVYDALRHMFVLLAPGETVTLTLNGQYVTVSADAVASLRDSNWGAMGSKDLLDLVANVSDIAQGIDNTTFDTMKQSAEFTAAALAILGGEGVTYEQRLYELAKAETDKAAAAGKFGDPNSEGYLDAYNAYIGKTAMALDANTTILVAAKNSENASKNIISTLTANKGADAKGTIKNQMTSDPTNGLSQAALAYGLYNSYKYSQDPENFDPNATIDFTTALNDLGSDGFQAYLKTEQAQKDLEGYMAAMNTLTTNGNSVTDAGILVNGFDNQELVDMMQGVMGK